jgi:anti-anti-sigma factor
VSIVPIETGDPVQPLEVTSRPHGGCTVVRLRGELDIATAEELRLRVRRARREHGDRVVLDLAELEFVDSHGLSAILGCYRSAAEAGGCLVLVAPRPIVWRALEITGLHRRLAIADTVEEAVAAAAAPSGDTGGSPEGAAGESEAPEGEGTGPAGRPAAATGT